MLSLTRRPGEEIFFTLTEPMPAGTRIAIAVVEVIRNRVRIGISADRSITVDRGEIDERKRHENGGAHGNV